MQSFTKTSLVVAAVLAGLVSQAGAQTTGVTAPGGVDSVAFGQLGPSFTTVGDGAAVTTVNSVAANVFLADEGSMERLDQGNGWNGNFVPGDALLWNQGNYQQTGIDMSFSFATPISGFGEFIQADYFGGFTGTISAYDSSDNLLGTFSEAGNSTSAGDGSAIFLGISSDSANISSVDFNVVDQFGGDSLALGNVGRVPDAASTSGLLGLAALGLGMIRRKIAK